MLVLANKTEAQRILHILDDTLEGLTLLGGLPLGLPSDKQTLQASPQILTLFQKHHQLEIEVLKSLSSSSSPPWSPSSSPSPTPLLPSLSSGTGVPIRKNTRSAPLSSPLSSLSFSREDKIHHLYRSMTGNLVRALRRRDYINDHPTSISPSTAAFLEVLYELKSLLAQRFSTTLQEDLRQANTLGLLTGKEKYALDSLASLRHTWVTKQREQAKEATVLQTLRHKLEIEVAVRSAQVQEEEEMIAQELEAMLELAAQHHEETTSCLTQSIETLVPELTRHAEEHTKAENLARVEQKQLKRELAALIQHYESTLQQKQADLGRLQATVMAEDHELHELRGHFEAVESQEAELRAMENARQLRVLEGERMRHTAMCAIRIQAMFRGHKALVAFKALKLASNQKEKKSTKKTGKRGKKGEKAKMGASVAGKMKGALKAGAAAKTSVDTKKKQATATGTTKAAPVVTPKKATVAKNK
ncbi:Hypothetical protein NocV09_01501350 [Nannochloropsis oceanica]